MEDKIFFNDEGVLVTRSRVVVVDQTFAMNGITSVKVSPIHNILLWFFAAVFVLFGLFVCFVGSTVSFLIGCFFILAGATCAWGARTQYALVLLSASGETKALVSRNQDLVYNISNAVANAMIARG
jgi:hypothetical protein